MALDRRLPVLKALLGWTEQGPPPDAMPVPLDEDLYIILVAGALITFRALVHERLVLVRSIESA